MALWRQGREPNGGCALTIPINGFKFRIMNTPMIDYVRRHLDDAKERRKLPIVAEASGVPYRTLQKIASGETQNPRIQHVQALHDYFAGRASAA